MARQESIERHTVDGERVLADGGQCGDGTGHCRCHHCGMPQDRPTLDGSCPHCADIYPGMDPHPTNAARCDGCGHQRADGCCEKIEDAEKIMGTYCRGCKQILDKNGIEPGDHEQYTLMEGSQ